MYNPAYKTDRVANNNKDIIGELLITTKVEDATDMAQIMKTATAETHR
jgi:hypothetical protein